MVFKRNKGYYSELKEESKNMWIAQHPLFISGNKGLFPYFDTNNKYGVFTKNHKGLILKDIKEVKWNI